MSELREQLQSTLGDAYTLGRELGGGGMSRVFVAEEVAFGRQVVVKVLPHEMAAAVSIERFKREIALAARLQHPHIVPLHSAGDSEGLPFFTMPFIDGESLRARLARGGELPISEGVRILREVAAALDYAHEKGIVHRDIKPDNVLLSRGSAMVTDFGVAKALSASSNAEHGGMTSLGVALGTPAYMSPEQAAASPAIDARADIYAFGIMAYELFTGRPPFAGRSPQAILAAQVTEAPEQVQKLRPSLPPALSALVMKCLEKHPADRPQSAMEIIHALDAITTPSGGSEPTTAQGAVNSQATAALPSARSRRVLPAAAIVIVLAVIAGGVAWWATRRGPAPSAGVARTIAVLPFSSAGDTSADYFSDGVSDAVRSELTKVAGLTVSARSSSYRFKNVATDAREIGRTLGVAAVLEGSVRRSGQRLRVTADLVNVADGSELWSDTYDREAKDVFALQDSITHAIAGALRARLADDHRAPGGSAGTTNLAAYDLYMRARYLLDRRGAANLQRSAELFSQAAALDPRFAKAHAGVGLALSILPGWSDLKPDSIYPLAIAAAERAIAIDSTIAEAFAARGLAEMETFRWTAAESSFRRSIELDPRYGTPYKWLGETLLSEGRRSEAMPLLRRATELDPFVPISWSTYATALWTIGQDSAALAAYARSVELDPSYYSTYEIRAVLRVLAGQGELALRDIRSEPDSVLTSGAYSLGIRAFVYAHTGHRAEADAIVRRLEPLAPRMPSAAAGLGYAYMGLGDLDRAMEWLIRGTKGMYITEVHTPEFDPIRGHRRYAELLAAFNLTDQPIARLKPRGAK